MYGTVCTVVWEEGRRKAPSYPIPRGPRSCWVRCREPNLRNHENRMVLPLLPGLDPGTTGEVGGARHSAEPFAMPAIRALIGPQSYC